MTPASEAAPPARGGDPRAARWRGVRRLLAVRLDNLGDLLMTTPALQALRDGLPAAELTLLASRAGAAMAAHLPAVDAVWTAQVPWMPQPPDAPAGDLGRAESALVDRLAEGGFDAAVIFTVCTQSALPMALLCRMAGIPLRLAHSRENPYALLSDWVPDTDTLHAGMRHEVQRQLALVASVGFEGRTQRLQFRLRDGDAAALHARLAGAGIDPARPFAVLHPGATAASRRWPAERFGQVGQALAERGVPVVFSGDSGDVALALRALRDIDTAALAAPVLSLVGELQLGELAALIDAAALLVANNSAPAHLAAALGTPVVSLYALTNPQHRPWQVASRVLSRDVDCRWCLKSQCPALHHRCLDGVTAGEAVQAALDLLAAAPATPMPPPAAPRMEPIA